MGQTTGTLSDRTGLLCPSYRGGERSHFNERDTALFPTRSGVIGLLAAALGRRRGESLDDLARLPITVRTDRPGVLLRDLHTVGGGLPAKATVTTAEGKKRSGATGTLLTHRNYLADAAFTLALTADDTGLLTDAATALASPHSPPYLGRRSCPPQGPFLLGHFEDVLHHLVHLPIASPPPAHDTRGVEFLSDRPLDHLPAPEGSTRPDTETGAHPASEVNDQPRTFHSRHRAYRARPLYRRTLHLPAHQHTGLGTDHLRTLTSYLNEHLNQPEGSPR